LGLSYRSKQIVTVLLEPLYTSVSENIFKRNSHLASARYNIVVLIHGLQSDSRRILAKIKFQTVSMRGPLDTPGRKILQGWKEIADYVDRDERTVKRWEKQRNFPVRRMPGNGRANVYILVADLDNWLSKSDSAADPQSPEPTAPTVMEPAAPPVRHVLSWTAPAAFILLLLCAVGAAIALHAHTKPIHAAANLSAHYGSRVPGVDDLYLSGVYFYEQRRPNSLLQAEQFLQHAIDKDPTYAPAWSALAITHNLLREYGTMPSAEAYAKARVEAQKAIALDPNLSEPHASLAYIEFFWDWNAPAAEHEFRTAIALNPNSALAHHWYGSMLSHEARYTEALEQLDIAQRLAPNSTAILNTRAIAEGFSGHRDEADELLQEVTEQDPNFTEAHHRLSVLSLLQPSDIPRFLGEDRRWAGLTHNNAALKLNTAMDRDYKAHGETAMWQAVLQQEKAADPKEPTIDVAHAEASLGNFDAAFDELDRLVKRHEIELIGINITPEFVPLHHDPRYARLLTEIGLPPLR
jgi:Tfp pilus assembly protein PilF